MKRVIIRSNEWHDQVCLNDVFYRSLCGLNTDYSFENRKKAPKIEKKRKYQQVVANKKNHFSINCLKNRKFLMSSNHQSKLKKTSKFYPFSKSSIKL